MKFRNSIRWKMLITIIGLIVALVTMLTLLQVTSQKASLKKALSTHSSFLKEQMISRADKASAHLSGDIHEMITPFRLTTVRSYIHESVKDIDDLQYIILMQGGVPRVAYGADLDAELKKKILSGDVSMFTSRQREAMKHEFEVGGHAFMESVMPIQLGSEYWGVLRLGFSLDQLNQTLADSEAVIDEEIRNRVMQAVLTALFFLIIGTIAVFILTYMWTNPIQKLIIFSNKLAGGDFNAKPHISMHTQDEIGVLVASLEEMAGSLRHSYAQLEDYSHTLEHNVEQRTRELARARDEAISANQSKSDFLSNMSHEIRTPMNAVIGLSHLMLDSELTDQQRDHLQKIHASATSLLGIINDILDFSKIEAGKLEMEMVEFELPEVMDKLAGLSSDQAEKKGLDLRFDIGPDIPVLSGDPLRLGQVLVNLVSNAIKFTEVGGITVAAEILEQDEDRIDLVFTVTDSGIGIAEDHQAELFQSFSQADASTTRKYGGTGLGLAISKQLVEMMGGDISVESSLGEGSCFRFSASFAIAAHSIEVVETTQDESETLHRQSVASLSGAHLLVAEDNEINQEVSEGLLSRVGITVRIVTNGEQALAALAEEQFDAVLMDMQMPIMDGLDATGKIRQHEQFGDIVIIAMTANAMQGDREKCLKAGMNDYIAKPISPDVLYSTLLKWVKPARPQAAVLPTEQPVQDENKQAAPKLEGLEVEDALTRMGGDCVLYRRILLRFHDSQADVVGRLGDLLADENREEAQYIAHTLKGAAGNIGATEVMAMAAELEQTMVKGGEIGELFLDQLQTTLIQTINASRQWLALNEEKEKPRSMIGCTEALPLIMKMRQMLEDYDGDAVDVMGDLREALKDAGVEKDMSRLESMLDSYDFEAALEMLKRLQEEIG